MSRSYWTRDEGVGDVQVFSFIPPEAYVSPGLHEEVQSSNEPAAIQDGVKPTLDDTEQSLAAVFDWLRIQTQLSDGDVSNLFVSKNRELSPAASVASSATLVASDDILFEDVYDQLKTAAAEHIALDGSGDLESLISIDWSGGNSRTDELLLSTSNSCVTVADKSSPCPIRDGSIVQRVTGKRSAYFLNQARRLPSHKTSRPAWLKTLDESAKKRTTFSTPKTDSQLALDRLRDIERSPSHQWTYPEREFLCVLWRWYERCPSEFTAIFNEFFGLALPVRKVTAQFESHLRLYGAKACPEYHEVFVATAFDDASGRYESMRAKIESIAATLGLNLQQLDNEIVTPSGKAQKARAPRTRQRFRQLARSFKFAQKQTAKVPPNKPAHNVPADEEFQETWVDIEEATNEDTRLHRPMILMTDVPTPRDSFNVLSPALSDLSPFIGSPTDTPQSPLSKSTATLGFRVWNEDNWTRFIPGRGFVSKFFAEMDEPISSPLSPQQPFFCSLAHRHFHKHGPSSSSPFVSIFVSLLSLFNLAAKMSASSTVHFAVIDLGHPALNGEHKKFYAADVVRELRASDRMRWTRYKGATEYLVWGDLNAAAIVRIFSSEELQVFLGNHRGVKELLSLEQFSATSTAGTVAARMKRRNIVLDTKVATDIGELTRFFGITNNFAHIRDLVACLTDGWSIRHASSEGSSRIVGFARIFAVAANPRATEVQLKEIAEAFIEGFERGTRNIEKYAPRRSRGITRSRSA